MVATAENLIFGCKYKKETVMIVPGPLNHANAIRKLIATLVNGSMMYILNGMTNIMAFFNALDCPMGNSSIRDDFDGKIACCLPPSSIRVLFQVTQDEIGKYGTSCM